MRRRHELRFTLGVVALAVGLGVVAAVAVEPDPSASGQARAGTPSAPATDGPSVSTVTPGDSPAPGPSPSSTPSSTADGGTPGSPDRTPRSLLYVHRGPGRRIDFAAVLTRPRGGEPQVWFIPPSSTVNVPGLGGLLVRDVLRLYDEEVLDLALENALGLRIDRVAVADDERLGAVLQQFGPLAVDFPDEARVDDDAGVLEFAPGEVTVQPTEALRLLTGTDPEGELRHYVTAQAVLEGMLRAARDPEVLDQVDRSTSLPSFLVAMAERPVGFDTIPVTQESDGDAVRYTLRRDEVDAAVNQRFPNLRLRIEGRRPRVEVRNGVGIVGLARATARFVVPFGAWVTLTGNVEGFGQSRTQVIYYRDDDAAAAQRLRDALGVGEVVRGSPPLSAIDVTIIAGSDLVGRVGDPGASGTDPGTGTDAGAAAPPDGGAGTGADPAP